MTTAEQGPDGDDVEIEDLEADPAEAEQVTGGRLVDPCEGGE